MMHFRLKTGFGLKTTVVSLLALAIFSPTAHALVMLSNLTQPVTGPTGLDTDLWLASRFTTDNSAALFTLQDVVLKFDIPDDTTSNLFVSIYTDNGNKPDSALASLTGTMAPPTSGLFTYTPVSPATLSANTSYWVVAGVASGDGLYYWMTTTSTLFDGPWTIPSTARVTTSTNLGSTWGAAADAFSMMYSVSATPVAVPEAGTTAMLVSTGALLAVIALKRRSRAKRALTQLPA